MAAAVVVGVRHNRPVALEFSERIARIPVYPAAGGYAQRAPKVRLASNESPWPPLPAVIDAIQGALPTLNRYPDPTNSLLRERLSERYGVPVSRIAIGNGSCDILLAAGEALLEPGAELVYAWPSFSVYPQLSAASGAHRGHRSARRKGAATTSMRCCARSPSPHALSIVATRTTHVHRAARSMTSRVSRGRTGATSA